ncbi:MAG: porin [Halorhodospira sp.]
MRRGLLTLATASALTAPLAAHAEDSERKPLEFYGWVNLALNSVDYDHSDRYSDKYGGSNDGDLTLTNNTSAIGVRGAQALEGNLTAVYQWEAGVYWNQHDGNRGLTNLQRDSFVGLEGRYGRLIAGRLPLTNQHGQEMNLFKHQLGTVAEFMAFGGADRTDNPLIPSRISNALQYAVTLTDTVSASLTYSPKGNDDSDQVDGDEEKDGLGGQLRYDDGTYVALLTIFEDELIGADDPMIAVNGSWDYGGGRLLGEHAQIDDTTATTLGATYRLPRGELKAQGVITSDYGDGTNIDDPSMYVLGYDHTLGDQTTLYTVAAFGQDGATLTGYGYDSSDGSTESLQKDQLKLGEYRPRSAALEKEDSTGFAVGLRHAF